MKIKILEVYFNTPCEQKIVRKHEKKTELHIKIENFLRNRVLTNTLGDVVLLHINKITVKIQISELTLYIEFNNDIYSIGLCLPEKQSHDTYTVKKTKVHADNKKIQPRKRHKEVT